MSLVKECVLKTNFLPLIKECVLKNNLLPLVKECVLKSNFLPLIKECVLKTNSLLLMKECVLKTIVFPLVKECVLSTNFFRPFHRTHLLRWNIKGNGSQVHFRVFLNTRHNEEDSWNRKRESESIQRTTSQRRLKYLMKILQNNRQEISRGPRSSLLRCCPHF